MSKIIHSVKDRKTAERVDMPQYEARTGLGASAVSVDITGNERVGWRAWATLGLLALLYVVSFIDRTVLALLLIPLKADLALSDVQLGLLFGTAFGLFYALAGLPIARIADASNRKHLIIAGVLFWSLCTILTALVSNFWALASLRFGLAIGEAALTPAAYSLLSDLFPPRRRLIAMTLFSATGMGGSALAYICGAALIQIVGAMLAHGFAPGWQAWRIVFALVGVPGLVLASLLAIVAREPERQGDDAHVRPSIGVVWRHVQTGGWLYLGLFIGAGFDQVVFQGVAAWGPTYMQRVYGVTAAQAGYSFGVAQIIAGVGGALTLPILLRRLADAGHMSAASALPLGAAVFGALLLLLVPLMGSPEFFLIAYATGGFFLIGLCNAVIVALQYFAPPRMRATLTAMVLICISSFGLGVGPPLVAGAARLVLTSVQPLRWGLVINGLVGLVGCILFFGKAIRPFRSALEARE
jgi:MFS family permease